MPSVFCSSIHVLETCTSYILLYNKLLQQLEAKTICLLLSYSFCESGIWEQICWGLWLGVAYEAAIKRSSGTVVIWRLDWYRRNCFQGGAFPSLLACPTYVGLSMRLLKSPHLMGARFSLTYLGSYLSVCPLYFIVYTDQSWYNFGGGISEHECQEARSLGSAWRLVTTKRIVFWRQQLELKTKYIQERLCHLSFSWTFPNLWAMYWLPFEAMLKKFWT